MTNSHGKRASRAAARTLAAFLFFSVSPAFAAPQASQAKIQKGPYLQDVTPRSITVCWETDAPAPGAVYFSPSPAKGGASLTAPSPEKEKHHCVPLENLAPGAAYNYYVVADGARTETHTFRAAPAPGAAFRFAAYGDSRSHEDKHRAVANAILAEKPAFVLNTGDLVNRGADPAGWDEFFRGAAALLSDVPYYAALGNHEGDHPDYFKYFSLPGNERYYAFDYAGVRFIALDSNLPQRMDPKQKTWLREELKAHADDIVFVFFHHPPYTSGKHGSDEQIRGLWGDLFEKGRVDAVFNGHDHHYERAEPPGGVPYIVTGGGGAELRDVGRSEWTRVALKTYHYVIVDVKDGKWTARVKTPEGKVIDTFGSAGGNR